MGEGGASGSGTLNVSLRQVLAGPRPHLPQSPQPRFSAQQARQPHPRHAASPLSSSSLPSMARSPVSRTTAADSPCVGSATK